MKKILYFITLIFISEITSAQDTWNAENFIQAIETAGNKEDKLRSVIYNIKNYRQTQKLEVGEMEKLSVAYKQLAHSLSGIKHYKPAYSQYVEYLELKDEVANIHFQKAIQDSQADLISKEKAQAIQLKTSGERLSNAEATYAALNSRNNNFSFFSISSIILLLLVFSGLIYMKWRKLLAIKSETKINQDKILEQEKYVTLGKFTNHFQQKINESLRTVNKLSVLTVAMIREIKKSTGSEVVGDTINLLNYSNHHGNAALKKIKSGSMAAT